MAAPWNTEAIDSQYKVVTPENIAFNYQVAGPFRRLLAFLLDLFIRAAIILATFILLGLLGIGNVLVAAGLGDFLMAAGTMATFFFTWFYMAAFEYWWNGTTPGKWLLNLRVTTDDGEPINAFQSGVRNLFRYVDMWPMVPLPFAWMREEIYDGPIVLTFLFALLVPIFNRRFQRIGDLIAGTMVVIEDRSWLMKIAKIEDDRARLLAEYIPPNFVAPRSMVKAVATYVERRRYFTTARRREIARHLAEPLLEKFGLPSDTSYDLLLCALYYRTFLSRQSSDGTSDDNELLQNPAQSLTYGQTNRPVSAGTK
ncbi:RDD family protein [Blastopirellula marina]|uniref:RDD family protein n=1 Tax=Blastopirellula marina TaxID=124 RepID=A0A2S8FX19_9BACT|nr:RDD family protein [Blastopirellula marina]PQO36709.1 RDD family protein [Blastopirellula marina]PTL44539.1 RDD family protein [Blastopirellula marina]